MGGLRPARSEPRPAAFLDRDGTLNVKPPSHEYVTAVDDFRWLPGAIEGMVHLARAGFVLAVVSNQRGVARGLVTPEVLADIERVIQRELQHHGCRIEAFRYCPHDTVADCDCRKPQPGMITGLASELNLDLNRSWMIGDAISDVEAGLAAGCHTAQLTDGRNRANAELTAGSLLEAAKLISPRAGQFPEAALAWKSDTSAS